MPQRYTQRRAGGAKTCPICHKPLAAQKRGRTSSGKPCHAACLARAKKAGADGASGNLPSKAPRQWNTAAAEREFARNKNAVESGKTFRGHKPSGWKLGGSPSSAGESTR